MLLANGFDNMFGWYLHMRATSSVTSLPAPQIPLADHNCKGGLLMSCSVINGLCYVIFCHVWTISKILLCTQVFRSCWWMRLFQSSSPKRHVAYSSSPWVERFNLGRLTGWSPKMNKEKNTASYVDPITGKRKWHGTKNLKKTESFPQTK